MDDQKKQEITEKEKMIAQIVHTQLQKEFPLPEYPTPEIERISIPLSCGAILDAIRILPEAEKAFPAVIIRTPYPRQESETAYDMEVLLAKQGYTVLVVSVRGALKSTGDWLPFEHEIDDGIEVIDWVAEQPWCDGNIATMGASYLGHTQWSVAACGHPALKTCFISVYGPYGYDNFYRRGMFRQGIWTKWASDMIEENRRNPTVPADVSKAAYEATPQSQLGQVLKGRDCDWYNTWIRNICQEDPYWSEGFWGTFSTVPQNVKIPVMLHGGWFDIFFRAQMKAWRNLPEETRKQSRFVIGPWDHNDAFMENLMGKPMYPEGNILGILQYKAALEWFDYRIKGKSYPHRLGITEGYCIGKNAWETYHVSSDEKTLYLHADHHSLMDAEQETASVSYVYDPKDPTPSRGESDAGILFATPGLTPNLLRQRHVGDRMDVISFLSEPLKEDTVISGAIRAELYVSSSAPATAFTIQVMEMDENGESDLIRSDITDIRYVTETEFKAYTPGSIVKLELTMTDCLWQVKKGDHIRVDISSSNYPAYHVHPNTTDIWADTTESLCAKQSVFSGKGYPSRIILPVK